MIGGRNNYSWTDKDKKGASLLDTSTPWGLDVQAARCWVGCAVLG
jgi:hypothetical protein